MSTAHPTDPGIRILASEAVVFVDDARRATLWTCSWLVEDRYACAEPDFPTDLIRECGAKMRVHPDYRDSFRCDGGHELIPMEVRYTSGRDFQDFLDEVEAEGVRY